MHFIAEMFPLVRVAEVKQNYHLNSFQKDLCDS